MTSRIPTRLNHIACDGCNKSLPNYFDGHRSELEFPFGSLPYVLCSECCGQRSDYSLDPTMAIIRRAGRFSKEWQTTVIGMIRGVQPRRGQALRREAAAHATTEAEA